MRKWQPTPVFLPGKSHGQRSLPGYSPWGHKELDPEHKWSVGRGRGLHVETVSSDDHLEIGHQCSSQHQLDCFKFS